LIENGLSFYLDRTRQLLLLAALFLLQACSTDNAQSIKPESEILSFEFLQGNTTLESPLATQLFTPPINLIPPSNNFAGMLTIQSVGAKSQIEVLVDKFGEVANPEKAVKDLPPFSVSYISDGTDLIPIAREPQRSNHPYWELIPQPGKAWDDPRDNGWSRASLPFSLKENNQNCTHNGMMTFLYRSDGKISQVVWQLTSETCLYLKVDMWGTAKATYKTQPESTFTGVAEAYQLEVSRRLPVKPLSDLALLYPSLDIEAFQPPGINDASAYGIAMDGINYRSDCPSRYGPYPFCDVLSLPSYSLAKSMVGGLAYQLLTIRWPEFATTPVSDLIPECKTEDGRWDDVTPAQLLNMTTGNYDSVLNRADEDAAKMGAFFVAESHADKVRFSCLAWPRKSIPGSQWVYHTTDTYLLGVAMNAFLKLKTGPQSDIYRDLLHPQVYERLGLGPSMQWTQRTYDDLAQPFTGYGLVFHADDAIRLAMALNSNQPVVETIPDELRISSDFVANPRYDANGLAYKEGFWGVDASPWLDCGKPTWIAFMSGHGGITVAMFPNGAIYYFFTDSNLYGFREAAIEINKALNYCEE
jgi:hypothetical protein